MLARFLAFSCAVCVFAFAHNAHAQSCQSDADCPAGLGCDVAPQMQPLCPPGVPCPMAPQALGTCEAREIVCESDDDCPNGLACLEQDSGDESGGCMSPAFPSDGGVDFGCPTQPAQPVERVCSLPLIVCEADADCQADYECTNIDGEREPSCETTVSACMQGSICPPPVTVCEDAPDPILVCFPARVDCDSSDDCEEGWSCTTLDAEQQRNSPPGWEGASQICLPDGIALAVAGRIELGDSEPVSAGPMSGDGDGDGFMNGGAGSGPGGDGDGDEDVAAPSGGGDADAGADDDGAADDAESGDGDGGCSVARVAGGDADRFNAIALVALAALAVIRRRTRPRSPTSACRSCVTAE